MRPTRIKRLCNSAIDHVDHDLGTIRGYAYRTGSQRKSRRVGHADYSVVTDYLIDVLN